MRILTVLLTTLSAGFIAGAHAENGFQLTSSATSGQGTILVIYTCDGKNLSPAIAWTNPPKQTRSFAFILSDKDAPDGVFYHWVLYNIPNNTRELTENIQQLPAGTHVLKNTWGKAAYGGPCPPQGAHHDYIFALYALDATLNLAPDASGKTLEAAVNGHVLSKKELVLKYR